MTTLVRTAGSVTVNPVNALTEAVFAEPLQNVLVKVDAASVATSPGSGTTAGLTMVDSMTDVANAAIYPLAGSTQTFAQTTVSGRKVLTSRGQDSAGRRGHRLPVATIQGKLALFGYAIVKPPATISGQSEALLGSATDGLAAAMLQLRRASTGQFYLGARRTIPTGTLNQVNLNFLPDGNWLGLLWDVDPGAGRMRLQSVRGAAAADEDTGWQARFTGDTGAFGSPAGQGLAIGNLMGATDAATWDATKFRGSFTRLAITNGTLSDTPFTGTTLSRRAVLIEQIRAEVNVLNAIGA